MSTESQSQMRRPQNDILAAIELHAKFLIIFTCCCCSLLFVFAAATGRCSAWPKHNLVAAINFGFIRLLSVNNGL